MPSFAAAIEDEDSGVALDLTSATGVFLMVRPLDGVWVGSPTLTAEGWYEAECSVSDAAAGVVVYDWLAEDVAFFPVGVMDMAVRVEFVGSTVIAPLGGAAQLVVSSGVEPELRHILVTTDDRALLTATGEQLLTTEASWPLV